MGNDKVLSYHDVVLRRADVRLLEEGEWLNDALISFYFEYLRQDAAKDLKGRLLLLPPDVAFLLSTLAPAEVPAVLGSLISATTSLVLMPVNNQTDLSAKQAGGSHWSLLTLCRSRDAADLWHALHLDSMRGENNAAATALARAAAHLVGGTVQALEFADVPQQQNCFDCGAFVLAFAAALCRAASGLPPGASAAASCLPGASTAASQLMMTAQAFLAEEAPPPRAGTAPAAPQVDSSDDAHGGPLLTREQVLDAVQSVTQDNVSIFRPRIEELIRSLQPAAQATA